MIRYTLQLQQASSAFTLPDAKAMSDFMGALNRKSAVVGFTEIAERHYQLEQACRMRGYTLVLSQPGDVALAVQGIHKITDRGQVDSIPGAKGPASQGGHGPRPILWVTFTPFGTREHVTVCEGHWVTRKADNGAQQVQMTDDLADVVRAHSGGARLGFWMGDTNSPDRPRPLTAVDRALAKGELTSCWDELGKYPPTHEASTIDVIGSYDPDNRVECLRARRWLSGYSDHLPVTASYQVHPARSSTH